MYFYLIMRIYIIFITSLLSFIGGNTYAQTLQSVKDSIVSKSRKLPSAKEVKTKGAQFFNKYLTNKDTTQSRPDTTEKDRVMVAEQVKPVYKKEYHIGWPDGRVAEFNNAYTLGKGEVRLNLFGRSSVALSKHSELSSYLPLIIMPNLFFKHTFADTRHFAAAYETGAAFGIIPVAFASGILMPGAAVGITGLGIFTGNDIYGKLYLSYQPSHHFTFSVRGSASRIAISYHGLAAFAGAGGSGDAFIGVVPTNFKLITTYYYMLGGELDYVFRKRNSFVLNTSYSRFDGHSGGILYPSLYYTRAVKKHFHYSLGLFKLIDVPRYANLKSDLPVNVFYNFYWILNNGRKVRVN